MASNGLKCSEELQSHIVVFVTCENSLFGVPDPVKYREEHPQNCLVCAACVSICSFKSGCLQTECRFLLLTTTVGVKYNKTQLAVEYIPTCQCLMHPSVCPGDNKLFKGGLTTYCMSINSRKLLKTALSQCYKIL